ncbi:Alpha-pyrone synthesis polyketide synthase-like Pks18 [Botrimarina colliarenosi]|uniref:Alpha-pyrone synthesis polyketide synthase-like Pks18 n=1 Tax=Botrimarina colliarenosi TaxID=2528001 RepID=A0A5C6AEW5_9BACT|nr:type III polyketide synthase [Botrimarina colliarenosi]TWT97976.1 Alpha-pyrone synthesis polyketide synthase-like Pks18 [Botrimarina colliarenosi]
MTAILTGLGLATPEHSILQTDAADHALGVCVATAQNRRLAPSFYAHSGVTKRHSVLLRSSTNGEPAQQNFYKPSAPEQPLGPPTSERMAAYHASASDLAERAARGALADAELDASDVTHLVLVTCSGFEAPGVDVSLIERLPLPPTVARTSIGFMGCHGAINGLRVAKAFCEADKHARVLLVAVELCSLHYQYDWTPERIIANSLFADGAASVVISGGSDQGGSAERGVTVDSSFSEILPATRDAMSWRIGDHGFEMTLSAEVPGLVREQTRGPLERWLAGRGLAIADIASWAIHPGGPRILDAAAGALGLDPDAVQASRQVLAAFGNMSSPTVFFVLDALRRGGDRGPCVLLGFGPGLAIEAALLR